MKATIISIILMTVLGSVFFFVDNVLTLKLMGVLVSISLTILFGVFLDAILNTKESEEDGRKE